MGALVVLQVLRIGSHGVAGLLGPTYELEPAEVPISDLGGKLAVSDNVLYSEPSESNNLAFNGLIATSRLHAWDLDSGHHEQFVGTRWDSLENEYLSQCSRAHPQ